jgi:hypothetical protein
MALSTQAVTALELAAVSVPIGQELAAAINAAEALAPAADVAAVSPGTVAAVTVSTSNTYTDAAMNVALASVVADIQANRTALNAILVALKAAGLML